MKNIVIIGGGTGTFTLLSGLRKYPSNNSVIASTADDGGSGGALKKELGVIPPGDFRQCLIGLSYTDEKIKELFGYRFSQGSLSGHTVGNIILAALEKTTGNIDEALEIAGKMLNIRGQIIPVTLKPTLLSAVLKNGKKIVGEHNIDEGKGVGNQQISKMVLTPSISANPKALEVIKKADVIIFGPGDLYTSTIPNLLVKGVKEAVVKSKAKKVLITNLMTKFGQTDGFVASDFAKELEKYLGSKIDYALVNNKKPSTDILKKYSAQKSKFVEADVKDLAQLKIEVIAQDFLSSDVIEKQKGDVLKRSILRHDTDKIAKVIWNLI